MKQELRYEDRLWNIAQLVAMLAVKRKEPLSYTRAFISKETGILPTQLSKIETATKSFFTKKVDILDEFFFKELGENVLSQKVE